MALFFIFALLFSSCFYEDPDYYVENEHENAKPIDPGYDSTTSTLTDLRDGQTYKTIVINKKIWMAEDLNYSISSSNDTTCYLSNWTNEKKCANSYTWAEAIGFTESECGPGHRCIIEGFVQGVCPAGWHVPTANDVNSIRIASTGYCFRCDDYFWGDSVLTYMENSQNLKYFYFGNGVSSNYWTSVDNYNYLGMTAYSFDLYYNCNCGFGDRRTPDKNLKLHVRCIQDY